MGRSKNTLKLVELEVAADLERKRRKRRPPPELGRTRIAQEVRERKRTAPPILKNKSLSEIHEMDPDDPQFKHVDATRLWEGKDPSTLSFHEAIKAEKQRKINERRARARKWEAEVVAAQRVMEKKMKDGAIQRQEAKGVYDEERAIAEGILTLDEWDDEELIRGYRRNRSGRFGKPPAFVPREVQQEAFKRLVNRGERKLKEAYMRTIEGLVELSHNAQSEKVRLEAQKELLNRVVGKVPDRVMVARDEPWQDYLADSLVPVSEVPPLEMELYDDGVMRLAHDPELDNREDGVEAPDPGGSSGPEPIPVPAQEAPPSSRPSRKKKEEQ